MERQEQEEHNNNVNNDTNNQTDPESMSIQEPTSRKPSISNSKKSSKVEKPEVNVKGEVKGML